MWLAVLPYCLVNCGITYALYLFRIQYGNYEPPDQQSSFSSQGHALLSLLVSYLVVSKVFLSLDRYMHARTCTGEALTSMRELYQLALVFTHAMMDEDSPATIAWRQTLFHIISKTLHVMVEVLQDERKACLLARNEKPRKMIRPVTLPRRPTTSEQSMATTTVDTLPDPQVYAQSLRLHLYQSTKLPRELPILERSKLLDAVHGFNSAYYRVLRIASTPLPFAMIQMGRTFLFLWTFTLPFALLGLLHDSLLSVILFVFFLTYGFVGLEFVSMKLLHPFGNDPNDIQLTSLVAATIRGMESDASVSSERTPSMTELPVSSPHEFEPVQSGDSQEQHGHSGVHVAHHSSSYYAMA